MGCDRKFRPGARVRSRKFFFSYQTKNDIKTHSPESGRTAPCNSIRQVQRSLLVTHGTHQALDRWDSGHQPAVTTGHFERVPHCSDLGYATWVGRSGGDDCVQGAARWVLCFRRCILRSTTWLCGAVYNSPIGRSTCSTSLSSLTLY